MWSSVRSQAGKCAIPEGFVISYNDFGNDVVGDHQDMAVMKLKSGQKELDVEPAHILHKFDMTHHQVSLLEGIFRLDRSKNFSLSNINPLFVAINKERKLKFKRAENLDHENHFLNPADNLWYEIYEDMYDKFFMKPRPSKIN